MKKSNRVREGNMAVTGVLYALATLAALVTLYPMYYILILSLSAPEHAIGMNIYLLPKGFNINPYLVLVKDSAMWRAYRNTVMYAIFQTILMIFTSAIAAFALTFKNLKGRKIINMYLLITMFFSGGLIPTFLVILKLGLYNSPLALIIPSCYSVWNIILVKAYFSSIPETLRDAAKIDGANVYQILQKVYLLQAN